jgi:hypothetical protein
MLSIHRSLYESFFNLEWVSSISVGIGPAKYCVKQSILFLLINKHWRSKAFVDEDWRNTFQWKQEVLAPDRTRALVDKETVTIGDLCKDISRHVDVGVLFAKSLEQIPFRSRTHALTSKGPYASLHFPLGYWFSWDTFSKLLVAEFCFTCNILPPF